MVGWLFSKVVSLLTILALVAYHVISVLFIFVVHVMVVVTIPFMIPYHFVKVIVERLFGKDKE